MFSYSTPTGWFKLNDENVFPFECPRCFFDSDHEILRSRCEDLTCRFLFVFCLVFRQSRFFWKKLSALDQPFSAEKEKKKKHPEVRPRDRHIISNTCTKCQGLSPKNGVDISIFVHYSDRIRRESTREESAESFSR